MLLAMLRAKHVDDKEIDVDNIDTSKLTYEARMKLLRDFPVIVARHFDHRFRAFLTYIKAHHTVLGGRVIHHWY